MVGQQHGQQHKRNLIERWHGYIRSHQGKLALCAESLCLTRYCKVRLKKLPSDPRYYWQRQGRQRLQGNAFGSQNVVCSQVSTYKALKFTEMLASKAFSGHRRVQE